jgi:hypothetical protein
MARLEQGLPEGSDRKLSELVGLFVFPHVHSDQGLALAQHYRANDRRVKISHDLFERKQYRRQRHVEGGCNGCYCTDRQKRLCFFGTRTRKRPSTDAIPAPT